MPAKQPAPDYRFSGHETFPCRYTWLTKAARGISKDAKLFGNEDEAMVTLGVGKNMVRSMKFWAEAAAVIENDAKGRPQLTDFGRDLLVGAGPTPALDPYLEDLQTLWLIHWKLSTGTKQPLFAWDFLLNRWQDPYLTTSSVVKGFIKETANRERLTSPQTLEQMFEVFIHTYLPTRGRKGEVREDNLDCPLVELQLLVPEGVKASERHTGRHEPVFKFRREAKPEISPALFAYCVDDFWRARHGGDDSLPLSAVVSGHGGPGQIFKLPEDDIRSRVEMLEGETDGYFKFNDSMALPVITRQKPSAKKFPLAQIYQLHEVHD
jgi:hypothetical protein